MEKQLQFQKPSDFPRILRSRVEQYFITKSIKPIGNWVLYRKTLFGSLLFLGSYIYLVFMSENLWEVLISSFLFTQGSIFIAFNAMHDAAHGTYSEKKWVNSLIASTMDILGFSNFLWKFKHNILHHTFTNVEGKDDDIESMGYIRISPFQKWKPFHKFQFLYVPILYSLLTIVWIITDCTRMFHGKIHGNTGPKSTKQNWFYFIFMKCFYIFFMLFVPLSLHPPIIVFSVFLGIHLIIGLIITLIFSLAHITDSTEFLHEKINNTMEYEWMEHQLRTTTDFAPENSFAGWYLGGLNYQVVHHLFPHVSHVHYREIRKIVESTCREYNMPYHCIPTFLGAVRSHFRHLRNMGRGPSII